MVGFFRLQRFVSLLCKDRSHSKVEGYAVAQLDETVGCVFGSGEFLCGLVPKSLRATELGATLSVTAKKWRFKWKLKVCQIIYSIEV